MPGAHSRSTSTLPTEQPRADRPARRARAQTKRAKTGTSPTFTGTTTHIRALQRVFGPPFSSRALVALMASKLSREHRHGKAFKLAASACGQNDPEEITQRKFTRGCACLCRGRMLGLRVLAAHPGAA